MSQKAQKVYIAKYVGGTKMNNFLRVGRMSKSVLNNTFSGERAEERVAAPSLMQNGIEVTAKVM